MKQSKKELLNEYRGSMTIFQILGNYDSIIPCELHDSQVMASVYDCRKCDKDCRIKDMKTI